MSQSVKARYAEFSSCHRHVGKAVVTRICTNNNGAFVEGQVSEAECDQSVGKTVLIHFSKIYDHKWMYDVLDIGDEISVDLPLKQGTTDVLAFTAADVNQPQELLDRRNPTTPEPIQESKQPPGTHLRPAVTEFKTQRTFKYEEAQALHTAKELLVMANHEVLEHCVRFAIRQGYVEHVKNMCNAQ